MPEAGTSPVPVMPRPATTITTFSATPPQVMRARRFLAGLLDSSPLLDDAVLCLSEVATNAVRHSASQRPGGTFRVRATLGPASVRVEVTDAGGEWDASPDPASRSGHGLAIVSALATSWGIMGNDSARTVWFEIAR